MLEINAAQGGAFASSAFFHRIYDEAIRLADDSRDYLIARGPNEVRHLSSETGLAYSVETMRLTARLTQVVAWLLIQRAVANGEISAKDAAAPEHRLGGHDVCLGRTDSQFEALPDELQLLLERSESLFQRTARLDGMLTSPPPDAPARAEAKIESSE